MIVKVLLLRRVSPFKRKTRLVIIIAGVVFIAAFHADDYRTQRYALVNYEQGRFDNLIAKGIERRGYVVIWLQEYCSGLAAQQGMIYQETGCSPGSVMKLPIPAISSMISFIQWESLDWAVLGKHIDNENVAPHLAELATKGLVLRMDGTKVLASANSDYEILNSKVSKLDFLYYAYVPSFPDSIILPFKEAGYETSVIHGLEGAYMNLQNVYPKQGFDELFFREQLIEAGYISNPDLFMQQVADEELFACAADLAKNKNNYFHFIITISTHEYDAQLAAGNKNWPAYYQMIHYTDQALGRYLDSLPQGATVIIYGDHQSYFNAQRDRTVPFLIYVKGHDLAAGGSEKIFTRCQISHYLRAVFSRLLDE